MRLELEQATEHFDQTMLVPVWLEAQLRAWFVNCSAHVCWQTAVSQAVVDLVQLSVLWPLVTSIHFLATSEHVSSQAGRALQTRLLALVHKCYWHLVFVDNEAHVFAGSISCV